MENKLLEKFTYRGPYGYTAENCEYKTARYANGNPALQIVDAEGMVATCSVNPPDEVLAPGEIAIKDWSENAGMGNWLKIHGVIVREDPIRRIPSGFVEIPVYRLTPEGLDLFRAEPAE